MVFFETLDFSPSSPDRGPMQSPVMICGPFLKCQQFDSPRSILVLSCVVKDFMKKARSFTKRRISFGFREAK